MREELLGMAFVVEVHGHGRVGVHLGRVRLREDCHVKRRVQEGWLRVAAGLSRLVLGAGYFVF